MSWSSQHVVALLILVSIWITVGGYDQREVCEYRCNLANCVNNEVWHEVEMDGPNGDKIILQQTLRQRPRETMVGSMFPGLRKSNFIRKFMDVFVGMGERRRAEQQQRNEIARQRLEQYQRRVQASRMAMGERRSQRAVREQPVRQSRPKKRPERKNKRKPERRRARAE